MTSSRDTGTGFFPCAANTTCPFASSSARTLRVLAMSVASDTGPPRSTEELILELFSTPGRDSIEAAQHVLVPVDNRTGDHAGAVREQEHHEVSDLVRLPQLAHGQRRARLLPPVVARAVEPALGLVLALGVGPADVQAVDPDPVP